MTVPVHVPVNVTVVAEQLRRRVPGGVGTYAHGLLLGLARLGVRQVSIHASRSPEQPDPLAAYGFPVDTSRVPGRGLTRLWDWGVLGVGGDADVVHATSMAVPARRGRQRLTAMVHDLVWREVPEAFPTRGRRWHEAALGRTQARCAAIVVPSQRTADALGPAKVPVHVIEHGCDHLPEPDETGGRELLARLGVDGPYLLSVSTLEPRKNLERLVRAYERARPRLPDRWPLVVVGPTGWGPGLTAAEGVVPAGAVAPGTLAALYRGARCLAYVPLVEGFGLPAVEAMSHGAPVVASPMPSTAGAALEVSAVDVDAIAGALVDAAVDGTARVELIERGTKRASELTWSFAAEQHMRVWGML